MASNILLLWLEGPMQSWGLRARWDVRDTGPEPSKSGVIGLIGCSMGLGRDDSKLESLDQELLFGVRIDRPGAISTDYQTVTGYHRTAAGEFKHSGGTTKSISTAQEHGESTIVSPRDYLHDAAFLVALAVKPEHRDSNSYLLEQIKEALENPQWPPYLGRKSCVPTRPIFDRLAEEYQDMEDALKNEPWAAPRTLKDKGDLHRPTEVTKLLAWIECPDGEFERQDAMRLNPLRFYEFRRCRKVWIDTRKLDWRIP